MSDDEMSPAQLEQLLMAMCAHQTDTIKAAEEIITAFLQKSACVSALMIQITQSQRVEARQLAAIYLRKKIGLHWKKLKANVKDQIKAALLQCLAQEPMRVVRNAVAGVAATIAKVEVPANKWNELLDFLLQGTRHTDSSLRETSMMLFRALAEVIGKALKPHFQTLLQIFLAGLTDPNSAKVRSEALKALGHLIEHLETEKEMLMFRPAIQPMIQALNSVLTGNDEEAVSFAFEVFDELCSSDVPVINPHIPDLIRFMLQVACNTNLDMQIRERAKDLVVLVIQVKPKKIAANNLIPDILKCAFTMVTEPPVEHDDEIAEDEEEGDPHAMATEMIDYLVACCDSGPIYTICAQNARAMLSSTDNPILRQGGLLVFATLCESCDDPMRADLVPLLQAVCACLPDPQSFVREAAARCLTQMADHLQPEIIEHHQIVLPQLLACLESAREPIVLGKAMVAMQTYVQAMEAAQILPYLDMLMQRLMSLLAGVTSTTVQATIISAISAVATAARGGPFVPYFPTVLQMLQSAMSTTEDSHLRLRARATECAGDVAVSVGREVFAPYFEAFFNQVMLGFKLDFCELRECTYAFFSSMSELWKEDFAANLPVVLPLIWGSMDSDEGIMIDNDAARNDIETGAIGSDSDDDEEGDGRVLSNAAFRTGMLDEKAAAIHTLAQFAQQCGAAFVPFLERSLQSLESLIDFPHHFIRQAVVTAYDELFGLAERVFPMPQKWQQGVSTPLPTQSATLVSFIYPQLIWIMQEDDDKETAAQATDVLARALERFGMGSLELRRNTDADSKPFIQDLAPALRMVLEEKTVCQQTVDEEGDEETMTAHDHYLLEAATDMIESLSKVCGARMLPIFREYMKPLLRFIKPTRQPLDRASAVGCLAVIVENLKGDAAEFAPAIATAAMKCLAEQNGTEPQIHQNSAYCLGALAANCPAVVAPNIKDFAAALRALCAIPATITPGTLAARDNACSAVGKLITAVGSGHGNANLNELVPLFLSALPIRSDFAEAVNAYGVMLSLFQNAPNLILPHVKVVVEILLVAVLDTNVPDATRGQLVHLAKSLFQQMGPQLQPFLASTDAATAAAFMNTIQSA